MIPKLFETTATTFTSEGLGRLTEALNCTVLEKLNGEFELTMDYPAAGLMYAELIQDRIIVADAARDLKAQAFRIYKISKPLGGRVTVNAAHISYDGNYIPVGQFTATGFAAAAAGLSSNSLETNPFTLTTHDITNTTTEFGVVTPKSFRSCLGGSDQSIAQRFSGSSGIEFTFDNYTIYADLHRGTDKGYTLRYGKNITELKHEESEQDTITGVLPIWHNQDNTAVYAGDIQYNAYKDRYPFNRTVVYDCTEKFKTAPTLAQINAEGARYIDQKDRGLPAVNVSINFIDLYGTSAYAQVQPLEEVCMGDTVHVYYEPLGIAEEREVIETKWNVLKDRYDSIKVGTKKSSLADTLYKITVDVNDNHSELVSVGLRIDYEDGLIQSTIGNVTDLAGTVAEHTTQLTQTASEISGMASQITTIEGITTNISSWFTFDALNGLTIGQSGTTIEMQLGATALWFIDTTSDEPQAWVSATEGLGGKEISIGDPTANIGKRWRIFASSDGARLRFSRHVEEDES